MKTTLITTQSARICCLDVPEGATEFCIPFNGMYLWYKVNGEAFFDTKLPEGNWSKLGFRDEITEEQAKGIVDGIPNVHYRYKNYKDGRKVSLDAIESFYSLLRSEGVTGNVLVLIEKEKIK